MNKFPENLPNWLRWALVLPLSVATYPIAWGVAYIGGWLMNHLQIGGATWGDNLFRDILGPGFAAYAAIYVAHTLAPQSKRLVALIASGVGLTMAGFFGTLAVLNQGWPMLLRAIANIVGIFIALNSEELAE